MYGMINLAIQEFLSERYGQPVWQSIKEQAAPSVDHFLTMEQYSDEVTRALVLKASEITGKSAEVTLDDIGEYWIGFALRSGYGELLAIIGKSLPEALNNLDNMHTRVGLIFPDLRPPSFWCTDVDDHSLVLHYQSERPGLAPMVPGLVRGLGTLLNTSVSVQHIVRREDAADHDQFLVTFGAMSRD
jgi:heme-NO-binding protein